MNEGLTPGEHDQLRNTLLIGARSIKPVGAHRMQLIAASVALVLVAGVAGGAIVTASLLGAKEIPPVTTPSPTMSATPTSTPTPTEEPTPDPSVVPAAGIQPFGGDCASVLTAGDIAGLEAAELQLTPLEVADDPAVIGGISCSWSVPDAAGSVDWRYLSVGVYPGAIVPPNVAELSGVVGECGMSGCEYAEFHAEVWVVACAETMDDAVRAVQIVGPRAAADPGRPAERSPEIWTNIDCGELEMIPGRVLSRDEFTPYAGDAFPNGLEWDVLTANDAAQWCSVLGNGSDSLAEQIQFHLGPGAEAGEPTGWTYEAITPVSVVGASQAWLLDATSVLASTGDNTILVTSRFLAPDQVTAVTEAAIAALNARG